MKGELLALPFLMGSLWLALLAVRDRSWVHALGGGLLAGLALGFKQNLVGGMVFTAVLFVGSTLAGRLSRADFLRLASTAAAGAAIPVLGTVLWAWSAGVDLDALWYAVYGFRFDAAGVLANGSAESETVRAGLLVVSALGAGMLLVIGGFVVHIRGEWEDDAPLTAAVAAMLLVDVAGLVLGGSFWRDYLFPLLPATALCAALLARRRSRRGVAMRAVIAAAAVSTVRAAGRVGRLQRAGPPGVRRGRHRRGDARGRSSRATPSSSSAGAPTSRSPAACPRRTSTCGACRCAPWTPTSLELEAVVSGPDAPTWIVEWVPFTTWTEKDGAELAALVDERYEPHGAGCGDSDGEQRTVWLLRGADRPVPEPRCHAG